MNPYDWHSQEPGLAIPCPEVERVAARLRRGGSVILLGGRGMGKSVFLGQLRDHLVQDRGLRVLLIPGPPPDPTAEACLKQLSRTLAVSGSGALSATELVDAYFGRDNAPEGLVLLFDDLDRYATDRRKASPSPPARCFFCDLELTRRSRPALGVLATGSIGVFAFRDALGASLLSRAERYRMRPFDRAALETLARPFADRGTALSDEVLDTLVDHSGGIPALLSYGLEQLWEFPERPLERDVTELFAGFEKRHPGYVSDVQQALNDPRLSRAPQRVLELVRHSPGAAPRSKLAAACDGAGDALKLNVSAVLELLQATGLVGIKGSVLRDDPVVVYPIPSVVNRLTPASRKTPFRKNARRAQSTFFTKLHRSSARLLRTKRSGISLAARLAALFLWALVIAEAVARMNFPFYNRVEMVFDRTWKIYKGKPRTGGETWKGERNGEFHFNNDGWNSPRVYYPERRAGITRIACIGQGTSSFFNKPAELYPQVLERTLALHGLGHEVYAFGTEGMSLAQVLHVSRYVIAQFSPDIITVDNFSGELLAETSRREYYLTLAGGTDGIFTEVAPSDPFDGSTMVLAANRILRSSYFLNSLIAKYDIGEKSMNYIERIKSKASKETYWPFSQRPDTHYFMHERSAEYRLRYALAREYLLKEFQSLERGGAAKFLFLVVPYDFASHNRIETSPEETPLWQRHPWRQLLLNKYGLRYLDLTDAFADDYRMNKIKFDYPNDVEMNEHGHRVMGAEVANLLMGEN